MWPHFLKYLLFVLALIVVFGCEKVTDDDTDPIINAFEIQNQRLEVGEVVSVSVEVSDNEELNQLRLRMREAFSKSFGYWEFTQFESLSGTTYSGVYSFEVPDTVLAGRYSISLQVVDERGNASNDSIQYVDIIRPDEAPSLIDFATMPEIEADGSISLNQNDTLIFLGLAFDVDSIQTVEINILTTDGSSVQDLTYNLGSVSTTFDFGLSADSIFVNTLISIPTNMLVKVTDSKGHMLRNEYPLIYTP
jgi:hypothetical protein